MAELVVLAIDAYCAAPQAAMLVAIITAMSGLLVTEVDRRRVGLMLERRRDTSHTNRCDESRRVPGRTREGGDKMARIDTISAGPHPIGMSMAQDDEGVFGADDERGDEFRRRKTRTLTAQVLRRQMPKSVVTRAGGP